MKRGDVGFLSYVVKTHFQTLGDDIFDISPSRWFFSPFIKVWCVLTSLDVR